MAKKANSLEIISVSIPKEALSELDRMGAQTGYTSRSELIRDSIRNFLKDKQEIDKLRRDIDRIFDRLWDDFKVPYFPSPARQVPSIDLSETAENLILRAEIPGIKPEDLHITIQENILTIKGEIKSESYDSDGNYHRMESRRGYFSRVVELPCKVVIDDVDARYENGILSIMMPKCADETCTVKIEVI